jgi:predicted DCC family thiol-disulfide oxidoreductase YuxK
MDDAAALVVIYDAGCAFCCATARWIQRRDRRRRLRLEPIADVVEVRGLRIPRAVLEVEMHVVDAGGRMERGFRAWRRIAREVPLLLPVWPLLWLPGVAPIGDRVYRWVAAHRTWLSHVLRFDACGPACSAPRGRGR